MGFLDVIDNAEMAERLDSFVKSGNIPHAVIINGGTIEERTAFIDGLSIWAACQSEEDKPCGKCRGCIKVKSGNHSDLYRAVGSGKTNNISIDEIRKITEDAVIIPNDGDCKIYILEDADKRLKPEAQNAFLKTLEEPSQRTLFLLTAENYKMLLPTVLSRSTVYSLQGGASFSAEILETAKNIAAAILEMGEYPLLLALNTVQNREDAAKVYQAVSAIFRDALCVSLGGKAETDSDAALLLGRKITKKSLLELIDVCSEAKGKLFQNVNINLLNTWLCGEFRRIAWQK